jgi:phosphoglucomutase
MNVSPLAGRPAPASMMLDLSKLVTAYYTEQPDPTIAAQRVTFGTSGHRGSSFERTFNEHHILAIAEAICRHRAQVGITGPLFLGIDTHSLSVPARATTLEVLAAHGVHVMLDAHDDYTPTPSLSRAILVYNKGRTEGLADGIVLTPSHNPPDNGGFKYNPPNGGPADSTVTSWVEKKANKILEEGLISVKRIPYERALKAETTHLHDYMHAYVADLSNVLDFDAIRASGVRIGVDPLGGAGVRYWARITETYKIDLTVVNETTDGTFRFMPLDWDGKIRTDPSSSYAMQGLIGLKDRFDIGVACDADHDRHGIVTHAGLMPPNHYLAVMIQHLFANRPAWRSDARVGKTIVSSSMIDRVAAKVGRGIYEVPVGFKWFVDGLVDGSLGFVGEESAGASFLRKDGTVWTTDKDGLIPALLSAEISAKAGKSPSDLYADLTREFGAPAYDRVDAPATPAQKKLLSKLSPESIKSTELAGEKITKVQSSAPGNDAPLGGVKVSTATGWFAARPSGTENIYKIYVESFEGRAMLERIVVEAQGIVDAALAGSGA